MLLDGIIILVIVVTITAPAVAIAAAAAAAAVVTGTIAISAAVVVVAVRHGRMVYLMIIESGNVTRELSNICSSNKKCPLVLAFQKTELFHEIHFFPVFLLLLLFWPSILFWPQILN